MGKLGSIIALVFILLLLIVAMVFLIAITHSNHKKDNKTSKASDKKGMKKGAAQKTDILSKEVDVDDYLSTTRKNARDICAADGIDPSQLGYVVVNDGGRDVYECALYADKVPRRSKFAQTFANLMNFPNCTTSVFWNPLSPRP